MDTEFEKFFEACVEALLFTDVPDDHNGIATLAGETEAYLRADCLSFWRRFGCYIDAAGNGAMQGGHDFWLTRNGHGAGFWDGDWDEPYGHMLDMGAKAYGEFQTYFGDDGLIYV